MDIDLEELVKKLYEIRKRAEEQINDSKNEVLKNMIDLKVKYLGKKSEILEVFKYMKNLSNEEKKKIGEVVNKIKSEIEKEITEKIGYLERKEIQEKELKEEIDLTLPVDSDTRKYTSNTTNH
jgi:phenylalanyl-tRNA synthetase, alpha subunit